MAETPTDNPRSPRPRRWLQFRLTTLLMWTLVAALAVGWWRERMHKPPEPPAGSKLGAGHYVGDFTVTYAELDGGYVRHDDVVAIDLRPHYVILHRKNGRRTLINVANLDDLHWQSN